MRARTKWGALLLVLATFLVLGQPGASAASTTRYCDTPGGIGNDQVHSYEWSYFYDSAGDIRARWQSIVINNYATKNYNGTEFRVAMVSDVGVHWDTGVQDSSGSYLPMGVPSQANAKIKWHPYLWVESGAKGDGYARCATRVVV